MRYSKKSHEIWGKAHEMLVLPAFSVLCFKRFKKLLCCHFAGLGSCITQPYLYNLGWFWFLKKRDKHLENISFSIYIVRRLKVTDFLIILGFRKLFLKMSMRGWELLPVLFANSRGLHRSSFEIWDQIKPCKARRNNFFWISTNLAWVLASPKTFYSRKMVINAGIFIVHIHARRFMKYNTEVFRTKTSLLLRPQRIALTLDIVLDYRWCQDFEWFTANTNLSHRI